MNTRSIEICVSKYKEDTLWLSQLSPLIKQTIYNKFDKKGSNPLPNVGREAHTYLHHIVENYDNLSDLTVFAQGGSPTDVPNLTHIINTLIPNLDKLLEKNDLYIDLCPNILSFGALSKWDAFDKKHKTLGDFFEHAFGVVVEDKEYMCRAHAIFLVYKDNILRHPKEFYLKLLDSVNHSDKPHEAHFMERLWKTILSSPEYYNVAQRPGEWRELIKSDGKIIKRPIYLPFDKEMEKSLFITR